MLRGLEDWKIGMLVTVRLLLSLAFLVTLALLISYVYG